MAEGAQRGMVRRNESRVNIEYEVETGGAQRRVQLPFVMAVMSDLKGDAPPEGPLAERKLEEVTSGTLGAFLESVRPRARFLVPDRLGGEEGRSLAVDLEFTSMADFTPAGIAAKVPELKALLEERNRLKSLLSMLDGRPGAEKLLADFLADEDLQRQHADGGEGER